MFESAQNETRVFRVSNSFRVTGNNGIGIANVLKADESDKTHSHDRNSAQSLHESRANVMTCGSSGSKRKNTENYGRTDFLDFFFSRASIIIVIIIIIACHHSSAVDSRNGIRRSKGGTIATATITRKKRHGPRAPHNARRRWRKVRFADSAAIGNLCARNRRFKSSAAA